MLAALIGGVSPDAIGAEENLPTRTVERMISDELGRRWGAAAAISQKSRSRGSRAFACS